MDEQQERYAYSVYRRLHQEHSYMPPATIDRQQARTPVSGGESEQSERGLASPYPGSMSPSDYCQSAAGEGYTGSSQEFDEDGELAMVGGYDEEEGRDDMDEEGDEDLSSEPPPQRSDGVSGPLRVWACCGQDF